MVVQYILASRTVTRSKVNSEIKSGAQESDTKPADVAKEKDDDDKDSTKESENSTDKEAEKKDVKDEDDKEKDEEEKMDVSEAEAPAKPTDEDVSEGTEKKSEEPSNDDEKKDENMEEVEEFYVKYRNFSYLHCEWKTEEELFKGDKRIASKLKRFKQKMHNNTNIFENVSYSFMREIFFSRKVKSPRGVYLVENLFENGTIPSQSYNNYCITEKKSVETNGKCPSLATLIQIIFVTLWWPKKALSPHGCGVALKLTNCILFDSWKRNLSIRIISKLIVFSI